MTKWIASFIGLIGCSLLSAQPTTQPAWREKFDAVYGLPFDQVLKHIQPPFIDERLEFYASEIPDQAALLPAGPNVMMISWAEEPKFAMCRFSGPDNGMPFREVVLSLTHLKEFELAVASELATHELKGDWSFRKDTDPVKLLAQCAAIVGSETNQHISVTQEIVKQDAIVAKGICSVDPKDLQKKILLPFNDLALCRPIMGNGSRRQFYEQLGGATGYPVIDENEPDQRDGFFEWGVDGEYNPPVQAVDRVSPETLDALLRSISDQTTLTFAIEPRKITRWRVTIEK